MFTTKFKVTLGTLAGLGLLGGLGANQLSLQQKMDKLQNQKPAVVTVVVTPTIAPTATPSATPKLLRFVPVTKVPTVTK